MKQVYKQALVEWLVISIVCGCVIHITGSIAWGILAWWVWVRQWDAEL